MRFLIIFWLCAQTAFGAAFSSTQSGAFSDAATWGGTAPSASGDTWTIVSGHTVWYDTDNSAHAAGWGNCTVTGTLRVTNRTAGVWLKMNGNISGDGDWYIGSEVDPITNRSGFPGVVYEQVAGQVTMTGNNVLGWYGETNSFIGSLTNEVVVTGGNSTNLFFAETVFGVVSNDVVFVDNHNIRGLGGSIHLVYSVETNRITLCNTIGAGLAATNTWNGLALSTTVPTNTRTNGTQVCKLSRPIVVFQPAKIASTGVFSASGTNTIQGVRLTNIGRGPVNTLNGWTVRYCTGNNNNSGGIAYYGSGHTISNCTGNNNSSGGIAYFGTYRIINSFATNNTVPTIAHSCYDTTITGGTNTASEVYLPPGNSYSGVIWNNESFIGASGIGLRTNIACPVSTNSVAHVPTALGQPTCFFQDVGIKPNATRSVSVWVFHTNNIAYGIFADGGSGAKPIGAETVYTNQAGGWTQRVMVLTNSTPVTIANRVWVSMWPSNSLYTGYSWVHVPTDYTIRGL